MLGDMTALSDQLKRVPSKTRPTVVAAIKSVKEIAPKATEVPYKSEPPRSPSAMWKLVRYTVDGKPVAGIGTFTNHATLFLYRGREVDDGSGLLRGSGKDTRFITLSSPADAARPAVKKLVRAAFRLGG